MPNTFELIASSTVGAGGAASIDFTSIPSTYTDLCIKWSLRQAAAYTDLFVKINGTTSTFTTRILYGTGSAAVSASTSNTTNGGQFPAGIPRSTYTASTFSNGEIYIPNYLTSNNKSVSVDSVTENNATEAYAGLGAGLWANTAAITQVSLYPEPAGSFNQYSTAYLYGVKNA